jgi:hypothetical protein
MPASIEQTLPVGKSVVDSFDAASAKVEDVVESLKRNGGCIIKAFMSLKDVDQVASDVYPYLQDDEPWEGDFFPKETRSKDFPRITCCHLYFTLVKITTLTIL